MRITLICIGKTTEQYLVAGMEKYQKRLKHYIAFDTIIIPDLKNSRNLSEDQQKSKEGALILKHIGAADHVILLDEHGVAHRSVDFADYINKLMVSSMQRVVFVVGGPYGFDKAVYQRSNSRLSLSKMTFSHQMIRLFFVEQLYRAFTILKGEPYHHE